MSDKSIDGLIIKYFVLSPMKDSINGYASRQAIKSYANNVGLHNPQLAEELRSWVSQIEKRLHGHETASENKGQFDPKVQK